LCEDIKKDLEQTTQIVDISIAAVVVGY
jgi:hypothetical protein